MFENISESGGDSVMNSPIARLGEDSLWSDFGQSIAHVGVNIAQKLINFSKETSEDVLQLFGDDQWDERVSGFMDHLYRPTDSLTHKLAELDAQWDLEEEQDTIDSFMEFAVRAVGGALPYMVGAAATGGIGAIAGASPLVGAALFGFAVGGQDAYEKAKASGATEAQAQTEKFVVGGVNALIETMQLGSLLKGASRMKGGAIATIANMARQRTWKHIAKAGGKFTWEMTRTGLEEALEEALQGTVSEGFPALFRDQEIEGGLVGFASRRAFEALGGGIAGSVISSGKADIDAAIGLIKGDKGSKIDLKKDGELFAGVESAEDVVNALDKAGIEDREKFEFLGEVQTLAGEVEHGLISEEEAIEHLKESGLDPDTPLDQVQVLGSNIRDAANDAMYKIYKGARADTVVHEFVENYFKAKYGKDADVAEINELRAQYEAETGNVFEGNNREWLSSLGSEYSLNGTLDGQRVKEAPTIFQKLKGFLHRIFAGSTKLRDQVNKGKFDELTTLLKEPFQKKARSGDIQQDTYMKGFSAKLTTIRNSADNIVAGAGNKKRQLETMKAELQAIEDHYDSVSDILENNPEQLAELNEIRELIPEYSQAVEDFAAESSKENFQRIKDVGDEIAALGDQYGQQFTTEQVQEFTKDRPTYQLGEAEQKLAQSTTTTPVLGEAAKGFILSDGSSVTMLQDDIHDDYTSRAGTDTESVMDEGAIRFYMYGDTLNFNLGGVPNEIQQSKMRQAIAAQLKVSNEGRIRVALESKEGDLDAVITSGRDISDFMQRVSDAGQYSKTTYQLEEMTPEEQENDQLAAGEEISPLSRTEEEEIAATEELERIAYGEPEPNIPSDQLVDKVIGLIKGKATKAVGETEQLRTEERIKRTKKFSDIMQQAKGMTGKKAEAIYQKALKELKGALPAEEFEALTEEELTIENRWQLNSLVNAAHLDGRLRAYETVKARQGLEKVLAGKIPQRNEIKLLEKVFGTDFAKAILSKRKTWDKVKENIADIVGLPRALMASMDVSGPGRQAIVMMFSNPIIWSKGVWAGYKSFASENQAQNIMKDIETSKYYDEAIADGVTRTEYDGAATELKDREEPFMSKIAEKFPLVGRSNRAFSTSLNSMRFNLYYKTRAQWDAHNKHVDSLLSEGKINEKQANKMRRTKEDRKALAKLTNLLTGRGDIGWLNRHAATANALFFSPKFLASRVQLLGQAGRAITDPTMSNAVRKIIAKDLVTFVGGGLGILSLIAASGIGEVEEDPRSSDFGKIKIGNQRIDFWGGYTPLVRTVARIASGESKSIVSKNVRKIDKTDEVLRFFRSKLAPVPAAAVDIFKGSTMIGEDVEQIAQDPAELAKYVAGRFTPLVLQDVYESIVNESWTAGAIAAPLAVHGIGVQAYEQTPQNKVVSLRNQLALNILGERWDEVGPAVQDMLRKAHPEIGELEAQARAQRTQFDFIADNLKEQKEAGDEVMDSLPKDVKQYLKDNNLSVGGLSRRIGTNWTLNNRTYQEYISSTKLMVNKVLPNILRSSQYQALPMIAKRQVLEYVLDKLKKGIRLSIIRSANLDDLQKIGGTR